MSKNIPQPGTYTAKLTGKIVISQSEKGYLIANIPYKITTEDVDYSDVAPAFLAKPDASFYTNSIKNLRQIFGWDGLDFFALEEITGDFSFELVDCVHKPRIVRGEDSGETEVINFAPTFINAIGASRVESLSDDKKAEICKQFASRLKAEFGGNKKPAKPAAVAKPAEPENDIPGLEASKPATAPAAAPVGAPASRLAPRKKTETVRAINGGADEVFDLMTKKWPSETQENLSKKFWTTLGETFPQNSDGSGLSAEQWGQFATTIGV